VRAGREVAAACRPCLHRSEGPPPALRAGRPQPEARFPAPGGTYPGGGRVPAGRDRPFPAPRLRLTGPVSALLVSWGFQGRYPSIFDGNVVDGGGPPAVCRPDCGVL